MSSNTATTEIEAFRSFLDEQIALGRADLTPEQSLALWRARQVEEFDDDEAAMNRALAWLDSEVVCAPFPEFIDDFQAAKHW